MTLKRFTGGFFLAAALFAAFFYSSFFANFWTTLSDYSGFGFTWTHQIFHNFLNGRPFQSSLFAVQSTGSIVGFTENPYAFIHTNVIHVNFTPYLFALIWGLRPTPAAIYGLIFLWNLAGGLAFTWLILKKLSPEDYGPKAAVAAAVFLSGGLLSVLKTMGQPLLFSGPFFLAAYYFLIAKRRALFFLSVVLLCLVSEDAAMVAVTFGVYVWLFEPGSRRYAADCLLFSVPYLLLVLFVVQPAARAELTLSEASTVTAVGKHLFHMTLPVILGNIRSMLPIFTLFPAFFISWALFGKPAAGQGRRIAALAILPALPHWGECLVVGGGHHLMPPFYYVYLALLLAIAAAPVLKQGWGARRLPAAAAAAAAVFLLFSLRIGAGDLPHSLKAPLYGLAGKHQRADALRKSMAVEEESNRAVIRAALALPPEASLVYWTNNRVAGFIVGRSDVWEFPDFFDQTDYLLIQKDAIDLSYVLRPGPWPEMRAAAKEILKGDQRNVAMDPEVLKTVRTALVSAERTHEVAGENEHILLLRRLEPGKIFSPPSTVGLGWTRTLFQKARYGKPQVKNHE